MISDASEGMLREAKKAITGRTKKESEIHPVDGDTTGKRKGDASHRFQFQLIDFHEIPCEDDSFDLVIANHVLFYTKDFDKVLKENTIIVNGNKTIYDPLGIELPRYGHYTFPTFHLRH